MKSKSFHLKDRSIEKVKHNKTFDFGNLYTSAAENNVKLLGIRKTDDSVDKEANTSSATVAGTPRRERSPNKKKKKKQNESVDISVIQIDGSSLKTPVGKSSTANDSKHTSTPYASKKEIPKVKSIMKNSSVTDDTMEESSPDTPIFKPKKRNKSVSFMLDDTEEVAIKRTKSEESVKVDKKAEKLKAKHSKEFDKKKLKKYKKNLQEEKENKATNMDMDQNTSLEKKSKSKLDKAKVSITDTPVESPTSDGQTISPDKKKKEKKIKKQKKSELISDPTENENESNNNEDLESDHKMKKIKKKKRQAKSVQTTDTTETEGEPATKARKVDAKADVIVEDLENLRIGDNAHTLTNLLDEMTVADKDKRKKNKHRRKRERTSKSTEKTASVSSSETADLEKIEEGKEKVKWKKRKWNKDKKGEVDEETVVTSVIIENLPLKAMLNYKTVLAEHFTKCGPVKKIGIAEVYPNEEPRPVFTTTINFFSADAAAKALEEDNTLLEGSRIRVKRPLPPTQTTLVVRSYADLSEQSLCSVFTNAGKIRSIRHLIKGRKSMATAFIEFDGPEAVERALKMAEDAKIGSKKIHVSKFELRGSKNKEPKGKKNTESENEGDSEESNDET